MSGFDAQALLARAQAHLPRCLELLADLVETNTHADNADGIASCHARLRPVLESLGFAVRIVESTGQSALTPETAMVRRHLVASREGSRKEAPTVLFLGHLDTVFAPDDGFRTLTRSDDTWRGPGVADMKGGIVTALLTLTLLHERETLADARVRLALASDEEQGSPTALPVVREAARSADVALCFEAARPCGGLVVARKGYGAARARVEGRSGHAGIAHDTTVNALTVLSRFIVGAEALEARHAELTISPGGPVLVSPASVTQVPDQASCDLEWRFATEDAGNDVWEQLENLARSLEGATGARITLQGGVECPPMARTPRADRLLRHYVDAAGHLGLEVRGVATAGVGDINFVAQEGVTCLDGVGPEGGGFHTDREFVHIGSIARRAAMNVGGLERFLRELREL